MLSKLKRTGHLDIATGIYPVKKFKNAFYAVLNFILAIPNAVLYCLLFLSLLVLEYCNFHLNTDSAIQLHTLTNFVSGHGITTTTLNAGNLVVYQPCSLWPAGLVVLLTPIYLLSHNTVASFIILKAIGFAFFILFLSRYLNYLQVKDNQKKFIIFFFSLSALPVVEFYASDMIATTICLWSFYFYMQYLDSEKKRYLLLSIFLVALCYFIRYSFLPFLLYPAFAFVLKEKQEVFRKMRKLLFIIFFSALFGAFFYTVNRWLVGPAQMVTRWDAFTGHAHWNQLGHFSGFLFTFGIYEWFFENMIRRIFDISITFNWISLLITAYFFWMLLKDFFSKKEEKENSRLYNSIVISLSAAALIIAFLSFLTINNPGQVWLKPYWTFVQDSRYYGPVIFIVLINILILFFNKKKAALLHIIVPLMIILNLYAYRTIVQSGFWGKNYKDYADMKSELDQQLDKKNNLNQPVVFFQKDTKNTDPYYYLQSQGVILLDKSNKPTANLRSGNFEYYELKKDSTEHTPRLVRIQN